MFGIDTVQAFLSLRPLLQADIDIEAGGGEGAFVHTLLLNASFLLLRMQDGTDLEARRRRAALFADDGELQVCGGVRGGSVGELGGVQVGGGVRGELQVRGGVNGPPRHCTVPRTARGGQGGHHSLNAHFTHPHFVSPPGGRHAGAARGGRGG